MMNVGTRSLDSFRLNKDGKAILADVAMIGEKYDHSGFTRYFSDRTLCLSMLQA
jgi:hypothetical protein